MQQQYSLSVNQVSLLFQIIGLGVETEIKRITNAKLHVDYKVRFVCLLHFHY